MNPGDETSLATPIVADSAPRVQLVAAPGTEAETIIACRRVVTLLGRRDGCKIRLPHRQVAPVHMAIVNNGSDVLAVDLVTPDGTLLNELKLEHERLENGDILKVGLWSLQVDIGPPGGKSGDCHPFGLEPTPNVIALEHMATQRMLQPRRDVCIVGRRQGCDIVLTDTSVSRAHALLLTYFGFPAVFDLLSPSGTLVNDVPISFRLLENNDVITVGESQFRVHLVGSPVHGVGSEPKNLATAESGTAETPGPPAQPLVEDLIDIQTTEGSQRWTIAESLEKAPRK